MRKRGEGRKGLHGWRRVLVCIVVIVVAVGGGIVVHNKLDEHQMYEIVHSDEAKKMFGKVIRNQDSKAFTPQGVIRSYVVDDSTIKHNPMGGIIVWLVINGNPKLTMDITLTRFLEGEDYGPLKAGSTIISSQLVNLLHNETGDS